MTTRKTYLTKVALAFSFSLLLTIIMMSSALAKESQSAQDEPYRVENFDISTPGELEVNTTGGHITVEGSSSNSVRVEMYVRKGRQNLLPEDTDLGKWEIDISQSGNKVKASAKRPGRNWSLFGNEHVSISFVVYTPREMSSDLNTSGGHIEVLGLDGNQDIATSGGHLDLADLKGTIEARTSGGHIDIADVRGDVEARTSGGHIDVQKSEGSLKVKTSGGHIDLADVSGTVEASTSGGNISANLNTVGKFVDLKTSGGNVEVSVPGNVGFDLKLRGSYVSTKLQNFSGEMERDEVEGKLNGGGPMISARTSGGVVSLSFKD